MISESTETYQVQRSIHQGDEFLVVEVGGLDRVIVEKLRIGYEWQPATFRINQYISELDWKSVARLAYYLVIAVEVAWILDSQPNLGGIKIKTGKRMGMAGALYNMAQKRQI